MKKTNAGYTINYADRTIVMTKAFAKEANTYGTQEYKTLVALLSDLQGYTASIKSIARNKSKKTYAGLTYENMEKYISAVDPQNKDKKLAEFDRIRELAEAQNAKYAFVKKWFLQNYPEYGTYTDLTENVDSNTLREVA